MLKFSTFFLGILKKYISSFLFAYIMLNESTNLSLYMLISIMFIKEKHAVLLMQFCEKCLFSKHRV